MTGDNIGSVGVSVTPDARGFWRDFEAQTRGSASEAGRRAGNDWQRGFDTSTRGTHVRVQAKVDTARARTELASLGKEGQRSNGGLLASLIPLAPALIPLGAAAGAAGAELVAMGAAGILAIKGISAEIKAGTPLGNQYASLTHTLKGDLRDLESVASGGVITGFTEAQSKLQRDMPGLNRIIAQQSVLLGSVTSHLAGGLSGGFRTFAPLLTQVEGSIDRVAARFERFATGPGGTKFAAALSRDYALVAPVVDNIATALSHLIIAGHGFGVGIVSEFGLFAHVLASFPTPVLTAIVDGFLAFKVIGTISNILAPVATSLDKLSARGAAAAASMQASSLQVSAAAAAEAATVAEARATEAEAVAASQAAIAASLAGTGSILEAAAAETAAYAAEEAVAFRSAAVAAQASAAQIAASAEAAGIAARGAGTAAAGGLAGMLGPIGLIAGGLLTLTTLFAHTDQQVKIGTDDIENYTQALIASNGAITASVAAQAAKALSDNGSLDRATKLGISTKAVTNAVTDGGAAYAKVKAQLEGLGVNYRDVTNAQKGAAQFAKAAGAAQRAGALDAFLLAVGLDKESHNFQAAAHSARLQEAALMGVGSASGAVGRALSDGTVTVRAYVAAVQEFNKSEDTAADRAKLLGAVLVAANGDTLNYANTMVKAAVSNQQLVTDFKNLKKGVLDLKTGTLDYHNAAAAPLLQDLQGLQTAAEQAASATYQHELATRGAKKAADDAFAVYKNDTRGALIDEASHLGLTSTQAKKLADQYFGIKNSGDLKKRIELLGGDRVFAALRGILADLDLLVGKTPVVTVTADTSQAVTQLNGVVSAIRALDSSGATVSVTHFGPRGKTIAEATGGYISGPGSGTSDSIPARLSNGEFVINAKQTSRHRNLLESINQGARGFETGGFVGVDSSGKSNKYGHVAGASSSGSSSGSSSSSSSTRSSGGMTAAQSRAVIAAGSALVLTANRLSASYSEIRSAAGQLRSAAVAAHASTADLRSISRTQAALYTDAQRRDSIRARLGTAPTAPTAYDRLANARANYSQDYANYKSNILGGFDITQAGTPMPVTSSSSPLNGVSVSKSTGASSISVASLIAAKGQAASQATRFVSILQRLAREGLDRTDLDQLASAGVSALPTAEALSKATPAQIRKLSSQQTSINTSASSLASTLAKRFDGAGVAAALGIVHGLQSQDAAITKAMDRLANTMVGRIKHKLGIHSPSRVFRREIAHNIVDSAILGLDERTPDLRAAATRVGSAMIPTLDTMTGRGSMGAPAIQLTVNPQPYQSEAEIGKHAANEIAWALAR